MSKLTMDLRILNNGEPSATISSDFTAPVHTPKSSVEGTPPASSLPGTSHEDLNRDAPLNKRDLRKRTYNAESDSTHDPLEDTLKPLTDEERRSWKGWVELESDPALFNYILRRYGVNDVKIQEVFSLDDETLSDLPKPVYGLIFLFKYRDNGSELMNDVPTCPKNIWFANQTINNACATVALLNIVMNVPDIDLGDHLRTFKESTRRLKPPYRGQKLGCDDFIRNIHNSFARKIDILNADLALQNEYDKWRRAKKHYRRKSASKKSKKKDDDDPSYHFIAYVPISGEVWRLDGLQREPENLGDVQDWIAIARDNIFQHISEYAEDGVEYSLMSLCKCPLRVVLEELAQNMQATSCVEKLLSTLMPDWKVFATTEELDAPGDLGDSFSFPGDIFNGVTPSKYAMTKLKEAESNPSMLLSLRREFLIEYRRLRASYMHELALIGQADEQAIKRKEDFTPRIYKAVRALAKTGVLKRIVQEVRNGDDNQ